MNFSLVINNTELTVVLIITGAILIGFIINAIIKMYKLKAENKRLLESDAFKTDVDESYKDFTEGHLYDNGGHKS